MKRFCQIALVLCLLQPVLAFQTSTEEEVKVAYLWFQFINGTASTSGHFLNQEHEARFKKFLALHPKPLHTLVNTAKYRENGGYAVWSLVKVGSEYQIVPLKYSLGGSIFLMAIPTSKRFPTKKRRQKSIAHSSPRSGNANGRSLIHDPNFGSFFILRPIHIALQKPEN